MTRFVPRAITAALAIVTAFGAANAFAQTKYSAEIRRTSFGIPHIKAADYGSMGYGVGYAYSQDNFCYAADEITTVRGERSRYFGATGATLYGVNNLNSDVFYAYMFSDTAALTGRLAKMKPEVQAALRGWVAGYNRYIKDVGAANLQAGCANPGVRAIDDVDFMRLFSSYMIKQSSYGFIDAIPNVTPPKAGQEKAEGEGTFDEQYWRNWRLPVLELGSNAVALGRDGTDNRRGMLLGNPHFPWVGTLRLWQLHVTVPGQIDSMGAAVAGVPLPIIGFNKDVAWTHTVNNARHFTLYKLTLDPNNPLKYVYDGQVRDLTAKNVTVQVKQADGTLAPVTRTIYSSHHGPLVINPAAGLVWSKTNAYAIRDANLNNWRAEDTWLDINRAASTMDIEAALDLNLGIPWLNTVAADKDGNAFYGDIAPVPNVDRFQQSVCTPDLTAAGIFEAAFLHILDGSRSSCEWTVATGAPENGLLPGKRMPRVSRDDYVQNSNDSYWLTNPAQNLYTWDIPTTVGIVPKLQNNRTRLGVAQALARLSGADGLGGTRFTLAQLQQIALSNRSFAADLYLPDMLKLCATEAAASVKSLCDVLAAWDRKFELSSKGAHLFKEFFTTASAIPNVYAVPFNPTQPLTTPSGLNITNTTVATALVNALAAAGKKITDAGLKVDAPLGTIQFAVHLQISGGKTIIPIHGGTPDVVGVYNRMDATLAPGVGYIVTYGTSYIQTVQYTDTGVNAQALLAMSQNANPASPNFADQTARFSAKQWITLPFTESAITSDPAYKTTTISE